MSDREEKTGKNDNGKKNKGGKRNKIVAIEMIILVLLIMAAVAIFIQRDKSVKEAAKIHNQKAKKTEQTSRLDIGVLAKSGRSSGFFDFKTGNTSSQ